jgi:hypothetical protein
MSLTEPGEHPTKDCASKLLIRTEEFVCFGENRREDDTTEMILCEYDLREYDVIIRGPTKWIAPH